MTRISPVVALALLACGNVIDKSANIDAPGATADGPNADAKVCAEAIDQRLDLRQSPPITNCVEAFIFFNGQSAAQVFTPSATGTVDYLRLRMNNPAANTNPVQVSIIDLGGNATALADSTSRWMRTCSLESRLR